MEYSFYNLIYSKLCNLADTQSSAILNLTKKCEDLLIMLAYKFIMTAEFPVGQLVCS
jgi:hypothetical protein